MTTVPDKTAAITDTVHRYLELVAQGRADEITELYADDATVEDPVGSDVHVGRQSIRKFYGNIENIKARTELLTLRVCGNEAAFLFRLEMDLGDNTMTIEPIDVMVFDADGRIASMKAYWN
ncbi:nuclear transport factor 2 family protein [Mycolicibacterium thermoresistibile]|uniref:Steroid delta-isomerase n=2 Tax=Mycolicibacterium thermoresistibile TaxID=1797 RepID=G7CC84_MYCT3|nr:nuclear transport factor 2 family protein [Mycolicibacterium thermoresistibile]EHI14347.1 steroid delta-isomerase [Mycolicibacterium thermoresistibile ATCC 19527]MCV7189512.1 nuclear transport factor 2 family protein [Mycolicibacterium thermoresistibile]GAT14499.1 steroid delta-isomerase [Mycolicibacterium thermoresistibile]SNW19730.1 steroid delta-isomerase [Mycolicibacterium thermoresistibile]